MIQDHRSFLNVRVSGKSGNAGVEAAEEILGTLDKLIKEEYYLPEQIFIWMKPFYSGNRYLKGLSSLRLPSPCWVLRL